MWPTLSCSSLPIDICGLNFCKCPKLLPKVITLEKKWLSSVQKKSEGCHLKENANKCKIDDLPQLWLALQTDAKKYTLHFL